MKKIGEIIFIYPLLFLLISTESFGQITIPVFGEQKVLNGYSTTISGETLSYFSVYPNYAKEALLTRCTDGKKSIEWETSALSYKSDQDFAYFSWLAAHSTGTSKGNRKFDLYINDELILTFETQPNNHPSYWIFSGIDSTSLLFQELKQDQSKDAHGLAYLKVPTSKYKKGKPLKMKIVGQNENSNDWYMTFKYTFEEKMDIEVLPFLIKNTLNQQPISFTILHVGKPDILNILINGKIQVPIKVVNGLNSFELPFTINKNETAITVEASIGKDFSLKTQVNCPPVVHRDIYLIHNSHTDIGYSHIQEEVEQIHNENIRQALIMIEKTKNYPSGSKFIWNIESLWAVENYLTQASEEEKKIFFEAVRNKQIELSALYANILTGLCSPEELDWITDYANELKTAQNLPIRTAMMSDIPGISWSIVHSLAKNGVRYFSYGPNYVESFPDGGDRIGSTLKEQGDKPFWWKSSSGKDSILLWTAGKGYSSWHGFNTTSVLERGDKKIATYMNELSESAYPYSIIHWRYNIVADNGPIDTGICDYVKAWNEKYDSPKLILSSATNLFEVFETKYGSKIPVLSGDFTPYWEDGAYSTALEETDNRLLSQKITQLETLAKLHNLSIDDYVLKKAKRSVILFHEHTWGAWNSISEPDNPATIHQWMYKKRFLDSAKIYVKQLEDSLFPDIQNANSFVVYNSLPWERTEYIQVEWPKNFIGNIILDDKGNKIKVQRMADGKLAFLATNIPANGKKVYQFTTEKYTESTMHTTTDFLNYSLDHYTGSLNHIKALGKEWINTNPYKGIGQTLYVRGTKPSRYSITKMKKIEWIDRGIYIIKQLVTCELEGTNKVEYELTHYKQTDYLHFAVIIDKKSIRDKESIHIALPFLLDSTTVRVGIDDGFITPEKGQIAGSNKDFYSVQRWIDVSNDKFGVTISSPQGALFEIGEMVDESPINNGKKRWKTESKSSSTLFLYAMNNYWHTNYKADQNGKVRFEFVLKFHNEFNLNNAIHMGLETTHPLYIHAE